MANNYIEEFFIAIGFDTKRVKKEAAEIDKVLDSLVSKREKQHSKETSMLVQKRRNLVAVNKQVERNAKREEDLSNNLISLEKQKRKEILSEIKARHKSLGLAKKNGMSVESSGNVQEDLRRRLAIYKQIKKEWIETNKVKVTSIATADRGEILGKIKEAEKLKKDQQRVREIAKAKHKAKLIKSKEKAEADLILNSRKELQARLTAYKKDKRQKENLIKEQQKQANAEQKVKDKLLQETKKAEAIKDKKQKDRYIRRKKQRASLAKKRLEEEKKAANIAKKALNDRLREFKKHKQSLIPEGRVRAQGVVTRFRETAAFSRLGRAQQRGVVDPNFNAMLDKAAMDGNIREVNRLKRSLLSATKAMDNQTRATKRLGVVQKGLTDSTRNMIRSYASVFAMFQGTVAIKRIGQDFQGMQASMLAASGSAPAAASDIAFINEVVEEMGLNLKDSTDAFVKFKFAAKGKMADEEIKALFKNVSMFGTALKVAPDDMKRAQRALAQMMSKGVVMSEELKMQLGDALPGAVQVFAKALGITEAELFKQMEQGKVIAKDVLPKVAKAYKEAAEEGGAYQLALKGLRVTEGQFLVQTQRAADTIFKSGFSAGLSNLYKTLGEVLKDSEGQLKKIGQLFGKVFNGLAYLLKLVAPLMRTFIDNFELMFGLAALRTMTKFAAVTKTSLMRAFLPITLALAAAEELLSLMNDRVVGNLEEAMGMQFNILTGETSGIIERDGKLFKDTTKKEKTKIEKQNEAFQKIIPDPSFMDAIKSISDLFGKDSAVRSSFDYYSSLLTGKETSISPEKRTSTTNTTVNNKLDVNVDVTGVPDQNIANEVTNKLKQELESSFSGIFNTASAPQSR